MFWALRTFARSFPLYTGISRQPLSAPSASPPRSSCLTCPASERTSASPISGRGGCRVEVSKLTDESSCSASMLMVRQASLSDADVCCWMMDMVARRAVMVLRGHRWGEEPERREELASAAVVTLETLQVCLVWPITCRLFG